MRAKRFHLYALTLGLCLASFVVLAGCGGGGTSATTASTGSTPGTSSGATGTSAPAAATIVMKNISFDPADLTIKVGQTVTWVNQDAPQHDVVANDGSFKSDLLDKGQTFSFTFTKAGTYPFYCSIHPQMKGTVTVQP